MGAKIIRTAFPEVAGGGGSRTTLDKINFTVPEQFSFFNAESGAVTPSTVSIEGRGPAVTA